MKRKEPEGYKVFFPWSNDRVFVTSRYSGGRYVRKGTTTVAFQNWMKENCGPLGILWKTERNHEKEGLEIYFLVAKQAMLAKLTWWGI